MGRTVGSVCLDNWLLDALVLLFEVTVRKAAMSDNEMQSIEKGDTRTVSIRAEIWHVLLEIAGRQIDPENAEVCCRFGQVVDTPIFRTSVTASPTLFCPKSREWRLG
jgi:hypothetical protein